MRTRHRHQKDDRYAPEEGERVDRRLRRHLKAALSARPSVIAYATFVPDAGRLAVDEAAGSELAGFWLETPLDVRMSRIEKGRLYLSEADVTVARRQKEPVRLPPLWKIIDAGGDPDQTLERARAALGMPSPDASPQVE